ncbi:hypothetical protein K490DRAFT_51116 [Saccharata proteae CBS 121410]|uniref:Integral membrane protein-like protein n=1 Tax=Saccharata proteae CBS 121410 TaxID=1314787 RepID=A0A9P4LRL3_9PEZI|nr:hypothetical protein K490DRAFT_51116 [Saccharata proteae CBS 121410]
MPSPIVQQTVMACILSATSNLLAQFIKAHNNGQPFTPNPAPILKFIIFTALNTPPNVLWQHFLEEKFPGQTIGQEGGEAKLKTEADPGPQAAKAKQNWGNVACKFLLDQTVGAAVNTVAFLAGMEALRGGDWESCRAAVVDNYSDLATAGLKLWPLVSLISFSVVPVNQRIVFGSLVGVAWGVYLSLLAA